MGVCDAKDCNKAAVQIRDSDSDRSVKIRSSDYKSIADLKAAVDDLVVTDSDSDSDSSELEKHFIRICDLHSPCFISDCDNFAGPVNINPKGMMMHFACSEHCCQKCKRNCTILAHVTYAKKKKFDFAPAFVETSPVRAIMHILTCPIDTRRCLYCSKQLKLNLDTTSLCGPCAIDDWCLSQTSDCRRCRVCGVKIASRELAVNILRGAGLITKDISMILIWFLSCFNVICQTCLRVSIDHHDNDSFIEGGTYIFNPYGNSFSDILRQRSIIAKPSEFDQRQTFRMWSCPF
jgi:hypothetical protein